MSGSINPSFSYTLSTPPSQQASNLFTSQAIISSSSARMVIPTSPTRQSDFATSSTTSSDTTSAGSITTISSTTSSPKIAMIATHTNTTVPIVIYSTPTQSHSTANLPTTSQPSCRTAPPSSSGPSLMVSNGAVTPNVDPAVICGSLVVALGFCWVGD